MTENEAIKIINGIEEVRGNLPEDGNDIEAALIMAKDSLEEIQRYREFGRVFKSHFSETACEILSDTVEFGEWLERVKWNSQKCDAANMELEKYRALGTLEELRSAVEKQVPKRPVKDKYHHDCCPNCGWIVSYDEGWGEKYVPHCENCGQAIGWEGLDERME